MFAKCLVSGEKRDQCLQHLLPAAGLSHTSFTSQEAPIAYNARRTRVLHRQQEGESHLEHHV
jgi:hypothetical protein